VNPQDHPELLDARGLRCVHVLLLLRARIQRASPGMVIHVVTDDPAPHRWTCPRGAT